MIRNLYKSALRISSLNATTKTVQKVVKEEVKTVKKTSKQLDKQHNKKLPKKNYIQPEPKKYNDIPLL